MSSVINLGLIGCGRVAERLYIPALMRLDDAKLVAIAEPHYAERPHIVKTAPRCLVYNSAEALLRNTELMGLIITSPPDSHIELVKLALLAGLPVLVEKPLTLKLSEIEKQSIRLFHSAKTVMMAFNRRFWEPACRMRTELLANRNVGPTLAKLVLETNSKEWDAYSGDSNPLEDLGPHQFDLLRYLFNCEIVAVNARWITRAKIKVDVELEDGIIAECVAAHGIRYREYISVQHGHNQYQIFVDSERISPGKGILRWILEFYDRLRRLRKNDLTPMSLSYDRQLKHFINCIRSGLEPNPGISSGIAAVQAIEAARKSIVLNGRRVLI